MLLQSLFVNSLTSIFKKNELPKRIGIALSGGVDSICLTHLMNEFITTNGLNTEIYPITINHNIRSTSSLEIPIIRQELSKIGLAGKYLSQSITLDNYDSNSFEKVARFERYKILSELCEKHKIEYMFLAHHLDDQLETFILRLLGNSSIMGLSCMQPLTKSFVNVQPNRLTLVRPMLDISKDQIIKYCLDHDIGWVQDYTNFEEINKRNIVRKCLKDDPGLKKDVLQNFQSCQKMTISVEAKVTKLYKILVRESRILQNDMSIIVNLKAEELANNWNLVIARFLFKLAYPLSPSPNYHYSFLKLYKKIPFNKNASSFSLLQLQWNLEFLEQGLQITIKRQTPKYSIESLLSVSGKNSSDWILFDERFWLKLHNNATTTKNYKIKTLTEQDRKSFTSIPKGFKYSKYSSLPIIIDTESQKIVSFPVLNLHSTDTKVDCKLKENVFIL